MAKKSVVVAIRLSKTEYEAIMLLAKRLGISKSQLIRSIVVNYLKYKGYLV